MLHIYAVTGIMPLGTKTLTDGYGHVMLLAHHALRGAVSLSDSLPFFT